MILRIKVKPNSSTYKFIVTKEEITCHVKAPAVEGKANEALLKFLAEVFNTSKSSITLLKGQSSRYKTIEINIPEQAINNILMTFKA